MSDDVLTYRCRHLRACVNVTELGGTGEKFLITELPSHLEGLTPSDTTGMSVSPIFRRSCGNRWDGIPCQWSLDSRVDGFEKMSSGLNARSIDFARFGQLILNGGLWNGKQLIPQAWVEESTLPDPADRRPWMDFTEFKESGGYYKYHWWGLVRADGILSICLWLTRTVYFHLSDQPDRDRAQRGQRRPG